VSGGPRGKEALEISVTLACKKSYEIQGFELNTSIERKEDFHEFKQVSTRACFWWSAIALQAKSAVLRCEMHFLSIKANWGHEKTPYIFLAGLTCTDKISFRMLVARV